MRLRFLSAVALLSLSLTASAGTLTFSTYLGGSDEDAPFAVAADHGGNTIVVGATASPDFLALTQRHGVSDAFLVKLDASGAIVFKTLLGGSGADVATSVAVDAHDNIYITGYTDSPDFPLKNAFQKLPGAGGDAFLMKLTSDGDLVYSTFLGGSDLDEGFGVAVDDNGRACVVLSTASPDLPLVNPAHGFPTGSSAAVFLAAFNEDGSALRYSTYLGGFLQEATYGVRMDGEGNAYVAGVASSVNFPTTPGAWQTQLHGSYDGYLTKFSPTGAVVFSTLFGGAGEDGITGLDVRNGGVYVTGITTSSDFPTRNPLMAASPGPSASFAAKFTTNGELVYSTYLGDGETGDVSSIAVNSRGEAFVALPVHGSVLPAKDGIQASLRGPADLYLLQLDATGSALQFATYFGGSGSELPAGLTVDHGDRLLVIGRTDSADLPLARAAQSHFAGGTDAFVALQFNPVKHRAVSH